MPAPLKRALENWRSYSLEKRQLVTRELAALVTLRAPKPNEEPSDEYGVFQVAHSLLWSAAEPEDGTQPREVPPPPPAKKWRRR